jgi:hypothetical protein
MFDDLKKDDSASIDVPDDLQKQVGIELENNPAIRWDEAVRNIITKDGAA